MHDSDKWSANGSGSGVGIMVLSSEGTVLYENSAAHHFLEHLRKTQPGANMPNEGLPVFVAELFYEMLASLKMRMIHPVQKQLQKTRWAAGQPPVLMQAFGLPDQTTHRLRVVITMRGIMCAQETPPKEVRDRLLQA